MKPLSLLLLMALLASCGRTVEMPEPVAVQYANLPAELDYNVDVKPLLSDRCFKCHGPDKNKIEAGLQLASFETATMELESGKRAIVPGNPAESELVARILSTDPEEMMPTPESHLTLSDAEKAVLIKWIEQGAGYKEHWSLLPIEQPEVPAVGQSIWAKWGFASDEETEWVRNEIDHFALAKMKEKGLKPAPEADKATLLRRVSMDLTGLPPAPEEVEAFLADSSPDAYEKAVDRLLQSPHFGEHQAVSWLDLARYADSHGYQDDGMRNAYPYRDWVIKAFNENLPHDQFIRWQLAGDLMPNPTHDMLLATSFNRQHAQTQEGGVIPEEYRTEYVADRVNTFGKAFLGLTFECARCHDHKYDPISAKDYYSLFAFFNQNNEYGIVPYVGEASPTLMLPSEETQKTLQFIREKIQQEAPKLQPQHYQQGFANWLKTPSVSLENALQKDLAVYLPFDSEVNNRAPNVADPSYFARLSGDLDRRPLIVEGKVGQAYQFRGDCGLDLLQEGVDIDSKKHEWLPLKGRFGKALNFERYQDFSVGVWLKALNEKVEGVVFQRNNSEFEGWRGFWVTLQPDGKLNVLFSYVYPANCIEMVSEDTLPAGQWQHVALTYDGSSKAAGVGLFLNGKALKMKVLNDNLTKSILHAESGRNWSSTPFEIAKDMRRKAISEIQMDEFRVYRRQLTTGEVEAIAGGESLEKALQTPENQLTADQKQLLQDFYLAHADSAYARQKRQLADLRAEETKVVTEVPEVMVMQELPTDRYRPTYILTRGAYDAPSEEVTAETPLKLGALLEGLPRNRLGLAEWLLDPQNPLFARVTANRFWLQFFNNGLVKSAEDFGNQGDLPTHPELLDWLAVQFRQDGWDTKQFLRRIVTSATYRQSSVATAEALEADPDNRWLARGPSYRYSAEQVRDNALAASGLLVRKIGGPSMYPYQPDGIWEALATRNATRYIQQHGDSLYRRSLYTIWKRSSPPPMMLNFDVPDRQFCSVRRQKTSTPLQSLVTLNDPQFVEAARVMAERAVAQYPTPEERIKQLYLRALSRLPRERELSLLKQLLAEELADFQQAPERAAQLLAVGEFPPNPALPPAELAAYTVVANTVLNLDEAVFKR